jgi:lysyl endopeptidase
MKKLCLSLLMLISADLFVAVSAQISQGGTPKSYTLIEKAQLHEVPFKIMPAIDVEALKKEDVYNDTIKDQPWRFGENIMVNLNPKNSGIRDILSDGSKLWRLGITSKGALSINLTFNNYHLPKGATLFIYNADKSDIIGAFTSFNNQNDRYFATTLIEGESIIIEYFEPAKVEFPGELNLWRVTHGYRGVGDYAKSFGSAGSCNVNAVCSQGDPIRDQIRSVAMLVTGGNGFCTGALINNTNVDGIPYFLSANHCYSNPGTVVFWFNWQSATCSNPGTSPAYNSVSGAIDKATYATSDFWLMQLNSTPPSDYGVYYSGWNHTTNASIAGTVYGIHHPSGDIKKISWSTLGVTTTAYGGGPGTDHWRITSWSDGTTTEPGSSGSPLFDPQGRIIGQLHGGSAACGNTLSDYYGKMGVSWTGGGTNSTRLSNWLDPAGTGVTTLDGYDPIATKFNIDGSIDQIISPTSIYGDTSWITPKVVIKNNGADTLKSALVTCSFNSQKPDSVIWSGKLASKQTYTTVFDSVLLSWGSNRCIAKITVDGDENTANDSMVLDFNVFDCLYKTLPLGEGFNSEEIPYCWNVETVSGTEGLLQFVTSGTHPSCFPSEGTYMIEFNSYFAPTGDEVRLVSPGISTISMENISISFDWYHDANYPSSADKVTVQYSFDGENWINIQEFLRYSATLSGWKNKTIDLPVDVENQQRVYFGFLFYSNFGNNCHFDNVNITSDITGPYADFTADLLSASVFDTITFTDTSINGPFNSWDWNFGTGANPSQANGQGPHQVYYTSNGKKTISLTVDDTLTRLKVNYIDILKPEYKAPFGLVYAVNGYDVQLSWNNYTEGFESGDFSAWDDVIEGPGMIGDSLHPFPYWYVSDNYVFEGNYNAQVSWGHNVDTWIISTEYQINENTMLSFIWLSSYYWNVYPNDKGDLWVKISTNGGTTWDPVWTFGDIGVWDNWTWYETSIDLSSYNKQTIQIAFNVVQDSAADVALDNVLVGNYIEGYYFGTKKVSNSPVFNEKAKSIEKSTVQLSVPFTKSIQTIFDHYAIYRDAAEIGTTEAETFTDFSLPRGTYTYYVVAKYSSPEGSSEPSNTIVVEVNPVSTIDHSAQTLLTIYPNPSDGLFNIEADRDYYVTVLDLSGNVVDEFNINSHSRTIDLSSANAGMYILKFRSDDTIFAVKVIVK